LVECWTKLVFAYLRGRPSLMRVCLLVDARHGLKKADEEALELLGKAAVPIQLVFTKSDLVRKAELEAIQLELGIRLAKAIGVMPQIITTSSRSQAGVDLLRAALAKLARPSQP
jgi:GTP-binding protein